VRPRARSRAVVVAVAIDARASVDPPREVGRARAIDARAVARAIAIDRPIDRSIGVARDREKLKSLDAPDCLRARRPTARAQKVAQIFRRHVGTASRDAHANARARASERTRARASERTNAGAKSRSNARAIDAHAGGEASARARERARDRATTRNRDAPSR
jgi:hypothetical protein